MFRAVRLYEDEPETDENERVENLPNQSEGGRRRCPAWLVLPQLNLEEIVEWQPNRRIPLQMGSFSKPLSRLATRFVETRKFERVGNETKAIRSFELNAKSMLMTPVLWHISFFLKRAIARHLNEIKHAAKEP